MEGRENLLPKTSILGTLASMPVQINDTAEHVEDRDGDLSLAGPLPLVDAYECVDVGDGRRVTNTYPSRP